MDSISNNGISPTNTPQWESSSSPSYHPSTSLTDMAAQLNTLDPSKSNPLIQKLLDLITSLQGESSLPGLQIMQAFANDPSEEVSVGATPNLGTIMGVPNNYTPLTSPNDIYLVIQNVYGILSPEASFIDSQLAPNQTMSQFMQNCFSSSILPTYNPITDALSPQVAQLVIGLSGLLPQEVSTEVSNYLYNFPSPPANNTLPEFMIGALYLTLNTTPQPSPTDILSSLVIVSNLQKQDPNNPPTLAFPLPSSPLTLTSFTLANSVFHTLFDMNHPYLQLPSTNLITSQGILATLTTQIQASKATTLDSFASSNSTLGILSKMLLNSAEDPTLYGLSTILNTINNPLTVFLSNFGSSYVDLCSSGDPNAYTLANTMLNNLCSQSSTALNDLSIDEINDQMQSLFSSSPTWDQIPVTTQMKALSDLGQNDTTPSVAQFISSLASNYTKGSTAAAQISIIYQDFIAYKTSFGNSLNTMPLQYAQYLTHSPATALPVLNNLEAMNNILALLLSNGHIPSSDTTNINNIIQSASSWQGSPQAFINSLSSIFSSLTPADQAFILQITGTTAPG